MPVEEKKEEEEVEVREEGEEKDILLEDFGKLISQGVEFDRLTALIPKLQRGLRIKVFLKDGKYFPVTKTGYEMYSAYRTVGFSYVPVLVVKAPPKVEGEEVKRVKSVYDSIIFSDTPPMPNLLPSAQERADLERALFQGQQMREVLWGQQINDIPTRRPTFRPTVTTRIGGTR